MLSCAHCLPKILLFLGVTVTALMSATQDEATLIREMPAEQWRASGGAVGRPDAQGIFFRTSRAARSSPIISDG